MNSLLRGVDVYLIGMMGAGKTAVGRELAAQLGYRFLDTDAVIEQDTGKSITELFASVEEEGFRDLESQGTGKSLCLYEFSDCYRRRHCHATKKLELPAPWFSHMAGCPP